MKEQTTTKQLADNENLETQNAQSNQTSPIADLEALNAEEIKGGPSSNDSRAIKITASTANFNHNETVSEDSEANDAATETIDDLSVSDEQSEEIAGGAVQKVREVAAHTSTHAGGGGGGAGKASYHDIS